MTRLLADLVAPYPGGLPLPGRVDAALAMLVADPELPAGVSEAINAFLESASEDSLSSVQEAVVRAGLWDIGLDHFVRLVAWLVAYRQLPQDDAARALTTLPHTERRSLAPNTRHLVEVADAVVEDAKDGIMGIEDDRIFRDAVQRVLSGREVQEFK